MIYSSDIRNSSIPAAPEENTQAAILAVLRYFEIFKHPLTLQEIGQYLSVLEVDSTELERNIHALVGAGKVWYFKPYFQSSDDAQWSVERVEKNNRADKILPKAYTMGRFIGHFPFIRAVMVSGSLSKHCMASDGDIDFFLITAPGRLWLARTLLVFYKKIFLFNSHKYFCINYLIDTEHLEIEEKNIFTATECATLLPIFDTDFYHKFIAANAWAYHSFYPNFPIRSSDKIQNEPPGRLKRTLEWCFSGVVGQWADRCCMQLTLFFWKRKFKHFPKAHFDLALKSRKYVSKHHPLGFQGRVLKRYEELMKQPF